MDETDRRKLRVNMLALSKDMDFDVVTMGLISRMIYEPHHVDKFQSKPGKMLKNQALLMDIESRGPKAFRAMVDSLIDANQKDLAAKLDPSVSSGGRDSRQTTQASTPHEHRPDPFRQPTDDTTAPRQWPDPNIPSDMSSVQMDTSTPYPQSMVDNDNVYQMKSKPRGLAVIINNKRFKTMKERSGTDVDCRNLENVFKQLGFNTLVHKDMKGKDMQQLFIQLARHNHTGFDCFILAILTHGIEGAIYGTDEYLVKIDDIIAYFGADRCPTLAGKPKLFFLQACRGERFDAGVESTDGTPIGPAGEQQKVLNDDELVKQMLKLELEGTDSFASARSKIPSQSDMLLAYATVPGYVSWRNSERGSWFIQAMTEVLLQHSRQEDLLSMMTMVNGKVARAFESSSGRHKQMPAPVMMLTKKLYFFPGFYNN